LAVCAATGVVGGTALSPAVPAFAGTTSAPVARPGSPGSANPVIGDGGWAHAGAPRGTALTQPSATAAISAPSGYPVRGIDVSAHDHDSGKPALVWSDQANAGIKFAYVKATEGTSYVNSFYSSDISGAKNVGIYAGAYAFGRPDLGNPVGQADYFFNHMQWSRDGRTLPPFLDMEWPYFGGVNSCYNLSATQMVSWIGSFMSELRARTGVTPMIYTNVNWWNPCTGSSAAFGSYLLDVSSCTSAPPSVPGWGSRWTFWQYDIPDCDSSIIRDYDVYHDDLASLASLAGGAASTNPSVVYNPTASTVEVYFNSGGTVAEKYWTQSGGWSQTITIGGSITGSPYAIADPMNGNVEVYFNSGGTLTEKYWNKTNGWSQAIPIGGSISGNPAAVYNPVASTIEVYFNSGGLLTENYWTRTNGWSGPFTIGGTITS
jgi:GH25 family lysozyme M1 (1,4-beta-N-acetylmuramidase)